MRGNLLALLVGIGVALLAAPRGASGDDWPQLQNGPQRPGYSTEKLRLPLSAAWSVSFVPERIYPANQPVVYQGKLYLGSESGKLHALDAKTGRMLWAASAKGPILGAAAADAGQIYFASLDGSVYAVAADDGHLIWSFGSGLDIGISAAVTLSEDRVLAVNRGGMVFALNPQTGKELWHCDVGAPLLQSPACLPSRDGQPGLLFIGGMDMRVYAIDTTTGELAWKSERLYGQAFKDYWPVVYRDKVIVRSMIAYPKPVIANRRRFYRPDNFPLTWADPLPDPAWDYPQGTSKKQAQELGRWYVQHSEDVAAGKIPDEVNAAQDRLAEEYRQHPEGKDQFVLDAASGRESLVTPHWCGQTMNGATAPPCSDRDGLLVVPMMYINSRWGRFDLAKNRITDILYDGRTYSGEKITELQKPGFYPIAGGGNTDENMIVTAAGDLIFSFHTQEANANYTGVWDMNQRRWYPLMRSQPPGGSFNNNTQGGGASPALVANGMLYHLSFHTITAWKQAGTGEAP